MNVVKCSLLLNLCCITVVDPLGNLNYVSYLGLRRLIFVTFVLSIKLENI